MDSRDKTEVMHRGHGVEGDVAHFELAFCTRMFKILNSTENRSS